MGYLKLFLLMIVLCQSVYAEDFDPGKAGFSVLIANLEIPYKVFAIYVKPSEKIQITSPRQFDLSSVAGEKQVVVNGWSWTAPAETGLYLMQLDAGDDVIQLNVFVLRPATDIKNDKLGEFKIGKYSEKPFKKLPVYQKPRGFIEVKKEHRDTLISPHFRIGQFFSKQDSGWPKYLVLRPELIIKLERILDNLNKKGIRADSLEIMSGYRTPWYNRAIGNRTSSSRHLYGGAADIFVDVNPRDGIMDDLNKDGKINKSDAAFLFNLIDTWSQASRWRKLAGGLAVYGTTSAHGPFVHVDARGYRARWGY